MENRAKGNEKFVRGMPEIMPEVLEGLTMEQVIREAEILRTIEKLTREEIGGLDKDTLFEVIDRMRAGESLDQIQEEHRRERIDYRYFEATGETPQQAGLSNQEAERYLGLREELHELNRQLAAAERAGQVQEVDRLLGNIRRKKLALEKLSAKGD